MVPIFEYRWEESIDKIKNYSLLYTCKKCSYFTKSWFFIKNHVERHQNTDPLQLFDCCNSSPEKFVCNECNFETYETVTFSNHVKEHQISRKSPQNHSRHMSKSISHLKNKYLQKPILCKPKASCFAKNVRWFCCDKCSYKTKTKASLRHHVIYEHKVENVESFLFEMSPYETSSKSVLRTDVTDKQDIEWLHCDKCSYKAKLRNNLKRHTINRHTASEDINWFECDKCSYKAKQRTTLKKHKLNKHTAVEDIEWFCCNKCIYMTKHRGLLRRHTFTRHLI